MLRQRSSFSRFPLFLPRGSKEEPGDEVEGTDFEYVAVKIIYFVGGGGTHFCGKKFYAGG